MSEPFLGEIKIVSFNFPPKGWMFCNGALMPINQNQALFSILGTTFGGNGVTTFALPDLRGRSPIHVGQSFVLGQLGGEEAHTVIISEMPAHAHTPVGGPGANSANPANNLPGANTSANFYAATSDGTAMDPADILPVGGSQPHQNMSPFLVLNFIIAISGIFPSRN